MGPPAGAAEPDHQRFVACCPLSFSARFWTPLTAGRRPPPGGARLAVIEGGVVEDAELEPFGDDEDDFDEYDDED